jgi:hypothetical protein
MAYPRRCPLCRHPYGEAGAQISGHVTVRSEPGGTHSPAVRDRPGRLLTLKCLACGGEYRWDFFAHAGGTPRDRWTAETLPRRPDGSFMAAPSLGL